MDVSTNLKALSHPKLPRDFALDVLARVEDSGLALVRLREPCLERERILLVYEVYRTAAKSAAGHPRAVHASAHRRDFDHHIELAAAHLEIIAEARVRRRQQPARHSQHPRQTSHVSE